MTNTWTYSYSTDDGYKYGAELQDGKIQHATPSLTFDGLTAGSACTINPQTDAVIPAVFTVTNETPSFPAKVGESIALPPFSIFAEVQFSDGPQCIGDESSLITAESASTIATGQSIRVPIFFVVMGYYTPNFPDGDPSVLNSVTVQIGSSGSYPIDASGPAMTEAGTSQRMIHLSG